MVTMIHTRGLIGNRRSSGTQSVSTTIYSLSIVAILTLLDPVFNHHPILLLLLYSRHQALSYQGHGKSIITLYSSPLHMHMIPDHPVYLQSMSIVAITLNRPPSPIHPPPSKS